MKRRLSDACPAMPEAFHRRVMQTVEGLENRETARRRTLSAALVAALIGALLLAGMAYAATRSGLLERLFYRNEPTEAARSLLVSPDIGAGENGVRLRVDEYLLDKEKLDMIVTFTSDSEALLLCAVDVPWLNGEAFPWGGGGSLSTFKALQKGKPVTWRLTAENFETAPDFSAPAEVTFTGYVLKPAMDLSFTHPGWGVKSDPVTDSFASAYEENVYELMTGEASALSEQNPALTPLEIYEMLGYAHVVETLPVTFTADTDKLKDTDVYALEGQDTFEFADYTLKVDRLEFTPTTTKMRLYLYPKTPLTEDSFGWDTANPLVDRAYNLIDPDGANLTRVGTYGGYDYEAEERGEPQRCRFEGDWPPVGQVPETVALVPSISEGERTTYLTDESVTLRVKKRNQ